MAKKKQKIPKGTKKNPWRKEPLFDKDGKKIKDQYFRYSSRGIWRVDKLPEGAVVEE
jgi:hypothetical protein